MPDAVLSHGALAHRNKHFSRIIMYPNTIISFLLAGASCASAAVLNILPTPMEQGGMIHINVAYNEITEVLTAAPEAGTPILQPLTLWKPGDSFAPTSPWYTTLDPSQSGGLFNSQFGLVLFDSDPLPVGSHIEVRVVSATAGLDVYRWRNTSTQLFDGIMGTGGSAAAWDWSIVSHGMFHPMFVLPGGTSGPASATLELALVDGAGDPLPGTSSVQTSLSFTAVPEPSMVPLSIVAGLLVLQRRRRPTKARA